MSKEILRKKLINLRIINFFDEKLSFINFKKILKKYKIKKYQNIGGYYPINCEIESLTILEKLERNKFKISLPVIKKNNIMDFYDWSTKDPLSINKYGIPEPVSNKIKFPKILFVPLLGFDKNLNRIGYGGGFYDRYIKKIKKNKKIITIGLAYSFQKIKKVPINSNDIKLDFIITNLN